MAVRIPIIIEFPDESLSALASLTTRPSTPSGTAAVATVAPADVSGQPVELPADWRLIERRTGETYAWPKETDVYVTFDVYEGTTSAGTVRLALGACERTEVRGKDRKYVICHYLTPGGAKRPISEFLETDDYEDTHELIAIIKGKDDGRKMYDPTDDLPLVYDALRTETYRDRIDFSGSYEKLGVVAHEDDFATMLAHTLIQAQSRFGLGPS